MREVSSNIQPLPIEFKTKVEAGDSLLFSKLFDNFKVSTPDGRSAVLQGFEQIVINFYAITDGLVIEQVAVIPEIEDPIVQRKEGNIMNFFYPYVFRGNSEENYFKIISGTGIIHFTAVGIVEPSKLALPGESGLQI